MVVRQTMGRASTLMMCTKYKFDHSTLKNRYDIITTTTLRHNHNFHQHDQEGSLDCFGEQMSVLPLLLAFLLMKTPPLSAISPCYRIFGSHSPSGRHVGLNRIPASCQHSRRSATTRQATTFSSDHSIKSYQIQGSTSASSKSGVIMTTSTNHTIRTDVPLKMGGKNEAPQPVELLLAAFIGCTQATALFVSRQMKPDRIILDRMEFDIQAVRDEQGALSLPIDQDPPVPSRLQRISGTVRVYAAKQQAISDLSLRILKEQTEQRCPVANMMIASGCDVDVDWIDGNTLPRPG